MLASKVSGLAKYLLRNCAGNIDVSGTKNKAPALVFSSQMQPDLKEGLAEYVGSTTDEEVANVSNDVRQLLEASA